MVSINQNLRTKAAPSKQILDILGLSKKTFIYSTLFYVFFKFQSYILWCVFGGCYIMILYNMILSRRMLFLDMNVQFHAAI